MGGVTAEKGRPVTGSGGMCDIGGRRSRPGSRRAPTTGQSGNDMSGFVEKRANGRWRARYRGPDGRERSKTFDRRVDADRWVAGVSFAIARGEWTDPARARVTVGDWSRQWLTAKGPFTEGDHARVLPVDPEDLYLADMGASTACCRDA